jgi:hypothetical protein
MSLPKPVEPYNFQANLIRRDGPFKVTVWRELTGVKCGTGTNRLAFLLGCPAENSFFPSAKKHKTFKLYLIGITCDLLIDLNQWHKSVLAALGA